MGRRIWFALIYLSVLVVAVTEENAADGALNDLGTAEGSEPAAAQQSNQQDDDAEKIARAQQLAHVRYEAEAQRTVDVVVSSEGRIATQEAVKQLSDGLHQLDALAKMVTYDTTLDLVNHTRYLSRKVLDQARDAYLSAIEESAQSAFRSFTGISSQSLVATGLHAASAAVHRIVSHEVHQNANKLTSLALTEVQVCRTQADSAALRLSSNAAAAAVRDSQATELLTALAKQAASRVHTSYNGSPTDVYDLAFSAAFAAGQKSAQANVKKAVIPLLEKLCLSLMVEAAVRASLQSIPTNSAAVRALQARSVSIQTRAQHVASSSILDSINAGLNEMLLAARTIFQQTETTGKATQVAKLMAERAIRAASEILRTRVSAPVVSAAASRATLSAMAKYDLQGSSIHRDILQYALSACDTIAANISKQVSKLITGPSPLAGARDSVINEAQQAALSALKHHQSVRVNAEKAARSRVVSLLETRAHQSTLATATAQATEAAYMRAQSFAYESVAKKVAQSSVLAVVKAAAATAAKSAAGKFSDQAAAKVTALYGSDDSAVQNAAYSAAYATAEHAALVAGVTTGMKMVLKQAQNAAVEAARKAHRLGTDVQAAAKAAAVQVARNSVGDTITLAASTAAKKALACDAELHGQSPLVVAAAERALHSIAVSSSQAPGLSLELHQVLAQQVKPAAIQAAQFASVNAVRSLNWSINKCSIVVVKVQQIAYSAALNATMADVLTKATALVSPQIEKGMFQQTRNGVNGTTLVARLARKANAILAGNHSLADAERVATNAAVRFIGQKFVQKLAAQVSNKAIEDFMETEVAATLAEIAEAATTKVCASYDTDDSLIRRNAERAAIAAATGVMQRVIVHSVRARAIAAATRVMKGPAIRSVRASVEISRNVMEQGLHAASAVVMKISSQGGHASAQLAASTAAENSINAVMQQRALAARKGLSPLTNSSIKPVVKNDRHIEKTLHQVIYAEIKDLHMQIGPEFDNLGLSSLLLHDTAAAWKQQIHKQSRLGQDAWSSAISNDPPRAAVRSYIHDIAAQRAADIYAPQLARQAFYRVVPVARLAEQAVETLAQQIRENVTKAYPSLFKAANNSQVDVETDLAVHHLVYPAVMTALEKQVVPLTIQQTMDSIKVKALEALDSTRDAGLQRHHSLHSVIESSTLSSLSTVVLRVAKQLAQDTAVQEAWKALPAVLRVISHATVDLQSRNSTFQVTLDQAFSFIQQKQSAAVSSIASLIGNSSMLPLVMYWVPTNPVILMLVHTKQFTPPFGLMPYRSLALHMMHIYCLQLTTFCIRVLQPMVPTLQP